MSASVAGVGVLLPLSYLIVRALGADPATVEALLLRWRTLELLGNTVGLAAAVTAACIAIALPLAWLTTKTTLRGRRFITVVAVLPLALPGYVIAYSLLALGSPLGPVAHYLGLDFPRVTGFTGSLIALTIYNFPFMFLNLRTALADMNPSLLEAGRSLGRSPRSLFFRVVVPQLRPGLLAGSLLVSLYVFGDFGVVSLMRFETFSYAIFLQYTAAFDRIYAAWLALLLLLLTLAVLAGEYGLIRGLRLEPSGLERRRRGLHLGWRRAVSAYAFVAAVLTGSLVLPLGTVVFWMRESAALGQLVHLVAATWDSLRVSLPAAGVAVALALPVAYLNRRYPSVLSQILERGAYLGYATPPLALALGLIFFVLRSAPAVHHTAGVLIFAYAIHFGAQAVGPIRTRLFRMSPRLDDAARSLGAGRWSRWRRVTLRLLRPGLASAAVLVFLSCFKELPLTLLLAPLDFQSLSLKVYSFGAEAMFAEAAPYALALVAFSSILVAMLFAIGDRPS